MEKFISKNKYSPSADAALIEQIATNDQLPGSMQQVVLLADQFCNNNNCQQEVQVCGLTLLRTLTKILNSFFKDLQYEQVETLKRNILMRFGDCQLSKPTRRICGNIIRQILFLTKQRHSNSDLNPTGHDINSLPWPQLFDQLLQVADDKSQDTNLRRMSLVVFAENMDTFYDFSRDIKFSDRHQRFVEIVKRWLNGSNYEFAIGAAECAWKSFHMFQQNLARLSHPQGAMLNSSFEEIVPFFLLAYRNACDVDEYDAEKQAQFAEHIESFFFTKNSLLLFQDPNQYQHLCDVFMPICRRNVGKNGEIVDVLCTIMLTLMLSNSTIHEFIATTPGEITKQFNFFVDLMCRWLEVEYDAEEWPHSFRPLSEDGCDLEEWCGFYCASDFISILSQIFDGKEVSKLMAQMLERTLESHNNNNSNNNNNNNNNFAFSASQKIPFNSAVSTFQQNALLLNNKYPQWMISASILWCFGNADQALIDRLQKNLYSLLNTFVVPAAGNHDHPFIRYSALYSVWRLHWRNMLPTDTDEARSIRKQFLEILARKLHAARDCFRVQEFAGVAIKNVFEESVDSDSAENNISNVQHISTPNLLVQSIYDSLSNHESKPNFVISSHLRALADVCDMTSSDDPLNFNDQLLPLLQHLVQKYHSILLQEIESSSNINNSNDDDEEESEFSRKARLNPSFKFDVVCFANSIRAATRVFKFLPHSEENQTAAKELTSFLIEMLETLQLRVKDRILVDLIYALEFLCTSLGENNFPNDRGGVDLVDRMMPPLIHYAMFDHMIRNKGGIVGEVSDGIVKVKQGAVDIICDLCYVRGELMKQKWTSSIGDIIIHLLETQGKSMEKMCKMGYDLFVAVGKTIGYPTSMDEAYVLEELARKKLVGNNKNNNIKNDEKSKPVPEEWKFLTKVANRVVLRFLGLKKVLDFENNFPLEPGNMNTQVWTNARDIPNRAPIIIACLLPLISPSIWEYFAVIILHQIVGILQMPNSILSRTYESIMDSNVQEFDNEYKAVMEKAAQLQARRQHEEQQRRQELLLQVRPKKPSAESGSRRQRHEDSDDDAETQEESTIRENQLDDDVLVRKLEQAKRKLFNNGSDVWFNEGFRALHVCLNMALTGIPAWRVTSMWNNNKFKHCIEQLIRTGSGGDLLGIRLNDWKNYFDDYYQFAARFLAEDAERGRMKNNSNSKNSSSLPVSLPLKTRLELIMPMSPSLDLSLVVSQTTQVPLVMKSVLESDFFNTLFQLIGDSQTGNDYLYFSVLSGVEKSWMKIVYLIEKFKFVPFPEHSGDDAVKLVFRRNAELSVELDRLLNVADAFLGFLSRHLESLSKSYNSILRLTETLCDRRLGFTDDELMALIEENPKFLIKTYVAFQRVTFLGVVENLFNVFPKEFTEGHISISKETIQFAESYLYPNVSSIVNKFLEPVRSFVTDESVDTEETIDRRRKIPLKFIEASIRELLETLTKHENLLNEHQKQQDENNVEKSANNNNDNATDDAAEKSKNIQPPKSWMSRMIERIQTVIPASKEKQPATQD